MNLASSRFTLLVCVLFLLAGCASFSNHELVDAGKLPDVSRYQHKPSVYVDYHFFRSAPGTVAPENPNLRSKLAGVISNCLNNTSVFSNVSLNEADKSTADYTLTVNVYNHGNAAMASISGFLTGFTFGVIPGAATDNYTIEAKLNDKAGATISNLSKKDSVTTWIGLWFIPVMSNSPDKAFTGTLDNQLRTILKELLESNALKYSLLQMKFAPDSV